MPIKMTKIHTHIEEHTFGEHRTEDDAKKQMIDYIIYNEQSGYVITSQTPGHVTMERSRSNPAHPVTGQKSVTMNDVIQLLYTNED